MPVHLFRRTYKTFAGAVRAVMRRKRIGKRRASAYVAAVDRRQHGGQVTARGRGRGRGGRPALSRMRRADGRTFRNVTIYKRRPRGYRWKVVCGGKLVSYVKRKAFALDFRKALTAKGRKGCRTLKA